ncbi:MAG: hypothetical protein M1828_006676 [Chrysothrix sp. TS-e1954]|nr:MAG: hypothetical protein M1828_006676 [Chrysothrix sp. TS-e1954]
MPSEQKLEMLYPVSSAISTAIIFLVLGAITLCLRFWVRLRMRPTYVGPDDYTVVIAFILVCGMCANQIILATIGELGRDGQPTTQSRLLVEAKATWAVHIIEKLAYGLIKLSVLFFYRRAFPVSSFIRQTNILIILVVAWTVSFFLTEVFTCGIHPEVQWMDILWKSSHGYGCANESFVLLWFAITDVISDILILSLPYPRIKKLRMSSREKWQLSFCFMLGFLSFIAGIVRLGYVIYGFVSDYSAINNSKPPTATFFWTTTEVTWGIVAANLPPLAPLLRKSPNPNTMASFVRHKMSLSTSRKESKTTSPSETKQSRSRGRKESDRSPLTRPPAVSLVDMGTKDLHASAMIRDAGMDSSTPMSRSDDELV